MIIDHIIETVVLEIIHQFHVVSNGKFIYESFSDVGESWIWWRADFQNGSRVLKKVFWTFSFLSISMAYNVISCQKVAENTQILKIA